MADKFSPEEIREYVDMETALGRVRGNTVIYKKMLGMFLNSKELGAFEEAMAAGDTAKAADVAHGIKGMTGNIGLTKLFETSAELMQQLRGGAADEATLAAYREAVEKSRACVEQVMEEL